MQSPPQYSSPQDGLPDLLLNSPDHKQKRGKGGQGERKQADKAAAYDFMSTEDELPLGTAKAGQGLMPGEPVQEKGERCCLDKRHEKAICELYLPLQLDNCKCML